MTPFLEFRLWWRGASSGTKVSAALVTTLVLALLVWIAVPSGTSPSSLTATAGSGLPGTVRPRALGPSPSVPGGTTMTGGAGAPSPAAGAGPTGASGAPGASGLPGTSTDGQTPQALGLASSQSCSGPPANLTVGIVIINVGGLNSTFGVPDTGTQQAEWAAVFDSVNKAGGVACHRLVADYETYNEFDTSTARSDCLAFVQHRVFAVLGGFLPSGSDDCVLQNHIPLFEEIPISAADEQHYYPYYFSDDAQIQTVYRNFAYASRQMGVFDPAHGFKKLGIFYRDCQPEVDAAMLSDLAQVGVPSNAIVRYNLGCSSNFASPSAVEGAVLQFKSAGVTTATIDNDDVDIQNITRIAQSQGFHPRWSIPDLGIMAIVGQPAFAPDPTNFDGALAITPQQYGGNTSGLPEDAADRQCDQMLTSHGQPPLFQTPDQFGGSVCNLTWMLVAGIEHAPSLSPAQVAAGLQTTGSVPFAFPDGPNDFSKPGVTTGGQEWRPGIYHSSCGCWKLDNPNFQPPF